jgi:hypothetical protein
MANSATADVSESAVMAVCIDDGAEQAAEGAHAHPENAYPSSAEAFATISVP